MLDGRPLVELQMLRWRLQICHAPLACEYAAAFPVLRRVLGT
jgi:hypothetical protein